ncbi:hypothetical protein [Sutcliffiella cohnii]|uniref:YhfM-like domain-containing protein n=1 Tax=Sutcliffiella cohnii TaxID=33932 RepID=A0A223KMT6_9BACI|nr:hypothetical protein [Sutcliffiella cohnii]AST90707.1 hypothetical protein BC6307_05130 [Sutcliffiella cohnii]MED4018011.1 hypothetical protein [Sutcliffiella cohnii]
MKKMILFICFSVLVACSSPKEEPLNSIKKDEVKEVTVYKMISFYEVSEEQPFIFEEKDDIDTFLHAVDSAKREPGVVDMADPEYKFKIGKKYYFLWIHEKSGTIMNTSDTNTIYSLTKESAEKLFLLLQ